MNLMMGLNSGEAPGPQNVTGAVAGAKIVAALNITSVTNVTDNYEPYVGIDGVVRQRASTPTSGDTVLFLFQGPG